MALTATALPQHCYTRGKIHFRLIIVTTMFTVDSQIPHLKVAITYLLPSAMFEVRLDYGACCKAATGTSLRRCDSIEADSDSHIAGRPTRLKMLHHGFQKWNTGDDDTGIHSDLSHDGHSPLGKDLVVVVESPRHVHQTDDCERKDSAEY